MEVTLHFGLPDLIAQLQYHINEQDSLPTELLSDISKTHTHGHTDTHFAFISIDADPHKSLNIKLPKNSFRYFVFLRKLIYLLHHM